MKVLIANDSFKGSLTASQVAHAVAEALHELCPTCKATILPIADGGEGLTDVLMRTKIRNKRACTVLDPLQRPILSHYNISTDKQTAIIEMAAASGLPLVEQAKRNPLYTSSYGTGQLIADALSQGCRNILIGIGGSATNDAGVGMLQALGFQFYHKGELLPTMTGASLGLIDKVDSSGKHPRLEKVLFTVACDVNNPFYGTNGAAFVYAPQKGADAETVKLLDKHLRNFAKLIHQDFGQDIQLLPGAGAAGGMGAALSVFLHAKLKKGIDIVLDSLCFDEHIKEADLVITGEGRMDKQTLMGKAPFGVLLRAKRRGIPCIALAGRVEDKEILLQAGFENLIEVSPRTLPLSEAMKTDIALENIKQAIKASHLPDYGCKSLYRFFPLT